MLNLTRMFSTRNITILRPCAVSILRLPRMQKRWKPILRKCKPPRDPNSTVSDDVFGMTVDENGHVGLVLRSAGMDGAGACLEMFRHSLITAILGSDGTRGRNHLAALDRPGAIDCKRHHSAAEQGFARLQR